MTVFGKRDVFVLVAGDLMLFVVSLWLTLFIRYLEVPDQQLFVDHLKAFSLLFGVWMTVFYISSMYEPHTVILRSKIPSIILNAQVVNSLIAVLFFYFVPYFGITPKTTLFLDLGITFLLISIWRQFGVPLFGLRKRQNAALIGSGPEMRQLWKTVDANPLYGMRFLTTVDVEDLDGIDFEEEVLRVILSEGISLIVVDLQNPKVLPILPRLYNLIFAKVHFVDQHRVYEDIFDRVPLSLLDDSWFLENISWRTHFGYDLIRRFADIIVASILSLPALLITPFVVLAIRLNDGGPALLVQDRIGEGGRIIRIFKFRTMRTADRGKWVTENDPRITSVGAFLRKSRIDELPQLWNVLRGDISLIGPRPELPDLVEFYTKEIPYYNIRHLIKPGLSGWAQVHHDKPPHSTEETKMKLSYDLYYLKNRSLVLDGKIALKTIKTLLSRTGI